VNNAPVEPEQVSAPEEQPARSFRRGIALLALLVAAAFGGIALAHRWKSDLKVGDVRVEGNRIVTTEEILRLAAIPESARLFDLDLFAVRMRVMQNPYVKGVSVTREVPNKIALTVEEREPLAAVAGRRVLYIDEDGVVLPPVASEHLPDVAVLTGGFVGSALVPGKSVEDTLVQESLRLLTLARRMDIDLYRRISEVNIAPSGNLVLYTAEAGVPVIVGRGDIPSKLAKLDGFWNEFVIQRGAKELQYVDLRFADQVVVKWLNPPDEGPTGAEIEPQLLVPRQAAL
jgi:cell division protein FtsQ